MNFKNSHSGYYQLILFFTLLFSVNIHGIAQEKKGFQLTGEAGIYADFYHMQCDTPKAVAARRPNFLGRLVVNTTLSSKNFSMPITLNLPTGQYGIIIPAMPINGVDPASNFKNFISNPLNRVGIAPKYKWAQLLLGSQIPQYSALTVGDLAVFGAGINLSPGKFRFSVFLGNSQQAISADTNKNIKAVYTRKIYSAKIGIGHEDSSHIYLIVSKMWDDTGSLVFKPAYLNPQNGLINSLDFRKNFGAHFFVKGEIAASAFTRDDRSPESPNFKPAIPSAIFTPKFSSRVDYASILSFGITGNIFNCHLTGRYYGDGFVPMGYPFLQSDRMDITLDPKFSLLKNKIQLAGTIGRRINNLSGIRGTTSTQTLASGNLNIQFTDNFSVQSSYSNFGFKNAISNDTFRVNMITQSWSIGASYAYIARVALHNFSVLYGRNEFTDLNIITGATNANNAANATLIYVFSSLKNPFSINSMFSYLDNKTTAGELLINSVILGAGYKFLKKKLSTNLGLNLTYNSLNRLASGEQKMLQMGLKYVLKKKLQFSVNASLNLYKYQHAKPGISFAENMLRTAITYKL